MLQQTRVSTVVPYFERWVERYPDVSTLADAGQEEVLKSWEGLGYYRRARMLHQAARVVRDRHGGVVPGTAEGLRTLPGIGAYTAGAIASIAFGRVEPAVDGNVRRVLARLFDLPEPKPAELRDLAARLVDRQRPGDFNQALMELGATVCTPRSPDCSGCPISDRCRAHAMGVEEERPLPTKRAATPEREFVVAVPVFGGSPHGSVRTLLVQRPQEGLLAGLWEFPTREVAEESDSGVPSAAHSLPVLRALEGVTVAAADATVRPLPTVRHVYSHFRGVYRPALVRWPDVAASPSGGGSSRCGSTAGRPPVRTARTKEERDRATRIVALADVEEVPLPAVQRKILELARSALADDG